MIQFKEDEVCRMIRSITYYRDQVSGNDYMWDQYNDLIDKLYQYGEETSPDPVACESE
jgi:hypothetical protein